MSSGTRGKAWTPEQLGVALAYSPAPQQARLVRIGRSTMAGQWAYFSLWEQGYPMRRYALPPETGIDWCKPTGLGPQ